MPFVILSNKPISPLSGRVKNEMTMQTIYHMLTLNGVSAKDIIEAASTEHGLAAWWTTGTRQRESDGIFEFHFSDDYHKEFKLDGVGETNAKLTCTAAHPEWINTSIEFDIEPVENGALNLHFRHTGWGDQTEMYGRCSYHWALYLKSLEAYLTTGQGQPTSYELSQTTA